MIGKFVRSAGQVAFFIIVSILSTRLVLLLHLPIPGSIVGIAVVFALLQFRIVKLDWIEAGAKWLMAEMLLFFIPPSAGMIAYKQLLLGSGLRIALVVVVGTAAVMACAGLAAERAANRKERIRS